jgi:hypothetical protein
LFSIQETLAFYTENILSRIIDLILLVIDIWESMFRCIYIYI